MPKKKIVATQKTAEHFCYRCAHVSNPRNKSVTGQPTLATCPYEKYAILYQRQCVNDHYKPK